MTRPRSLSSDPVPQPAADGIPRLRQPVPWLRLAGIVLVVLMTLGNAAANMLSTQRIASARERQRAEQNAVMAARRQRIAIQLAFGDRCDAQVARELARDIVFDGRSAVDYADDFAQRCGEDWIVRRWANASITLRLPRVASAR